GAVGGRGIRRGRGAGRGRGDEAREGEGERAEPRGDASGWVVHGRSFGPRAVLVQTRRTTHVAAQGSTAVPDATSMARGASGCRAVPGGLAWCMRVILSPMNPQETVLKTIVTLFIALGLSLPAATIASPHKKVDRSGVGN